MPVNYQDGKIYTLVNNVNNTIYVGSTAQEYMSSRMAAHRTHAGTPEEQSPLYSAMRIIGIPNFRIVLHCAFPCHSKAELESEEFRVLKTYMDVGTPVYNANVVYHQVAPATRVKMSARPKSDAHKKNISEALRGKLGKDNNAFSYGSVYYDGAKRNNWVFEWRTNGSRPKKNKSFSCGKYGNYGAHFRAEEFRKSVFPEYGTEEDIACDDLGYIEWD